MNLTERVEQLERVVARWQDEERRGVIEKHEKDEKKRAFVTGVILGAAGIWMCGMVVGIALKLMGGSI